MDKCTKFLYLFLPFSYPVVCSQITVDIYLELDPNLPAIQGVNPFPFHTDFATNIALLHVSVIPFFDI